MRYLFTVLKILLLLALFGFALKNDEPVLLRYYLGYEWHAPLIIYLGIFFVAGVAIGILATLPYIFRWRRQISLLKRELRSRRQTSSLEHAIAGIPSDAG